jgi:hypothetical protein
MAKKQKKDGGNREREEVGGATLGCSAQILTWKEQVANMSKADFEAFIKEKVGEILNKADDGIFEELADKVVDEQEEEEEDLDTIEGVVLSEIGKKGDA